MRLTADEQQLFSTMSRQFPRFVEVIERVRVEELELLPVASKDSLDVLRGRVQALTDIRKLLAIRS